MRVANIDAQSHLAKTLETCLQEAERAKNKIYLEECLQQRRHFWPFVASVGRLLGVEAAVTLKRVSSRLVSKWWQPYYRT